MGFSRVLKQWWTGTQSSCEGWGTEQERSNVIAYGEWWAWIGGQSPTEDPVKRFPLQVYEQKTNLMCSLQPKQAICQRTYAEFSGTQKLWEGIELFCQISSWFVSSRVIHCQYWMLTFTIRYTCNYKVKSEFRAWLLKCLIKSHAFLVYYWSDWILFK